MKPLPLTARVALVFGAMVAFLTFMAASQLIKRETGTEVVLQAHPVDPRSLFRGYYVILRTDISEIDIGRLDGADQFDVGDEIFVTVESDDGIWGRRRCRIGARLAARWRSAGASPTSAIHTAWSDQDDADAEVGPILSVAYNIESYFAEESAAKELEAARNAGELRVVVSVTDSGDAAIKGLEVDGVRFLDRAF